MKLTITMDIEGANINGVHQISTEQDPVQVHNGSTCNLNNEIQMSPICSIMSYLDKLSSTVYGCTDIPGFNTNMNRLWNRYMETIYDMHNLPSVEPINDVGIWNSLFADHHIPYYLILPENTMNRVEILRVKVLRDDNIFDENSRISQMKAAIHDRYVSLSQADVSLSSTEEIFHFATRLASYLQDMLYYVVSTDYVLMSGYNAPSCYGDFAGYLVSTLNKVNAIIDQLDESTDVNSIDQTSTIRTELINICHELRLINIGPSSERKDGINGEMFDVNKLMSVILDECDDKMQMDLNHIDIIGIRDPSLTKNSVSSILKCVYNYIVRQIFMGDIQPAATLLVGISIYMTAGGFITGKPINDIEYTDDKYALIMRTFVNMVNQTGKYLAIYMNPAVDDGHDYNVPYMKFITGMDQKFYENTPWAINDSCWLMHCITSKNESYCTTVDRLNNIIEHLRYILGGNQAVHKYPEFFELVDGTTSYTKVCEKIDQIPQALKHICSI